MVTPTQIANRALQRCGASRIADDALLTEDSKNASEIRACYDILRRAELRRNVWRFSIRVVALRPIGNYTKQVTFPAWDDGDTYAVNNIVLATDGYLYSSLTAGNLAHDPVSSPTYWTLWFGNIMAQEYVTDWSATPTYAIGDHAIGSDDQVYVAIAANQNFDPVSNPAKWSLATDVDEDDTSEEDDNSYYAGELVYIGDKIYLSRVSSNTDVPTASTWMAVTGATVAAPNFIYPIGSGPFSSTSSKNVYRLPNGFLRDAPQDPKAGSTSFLGAPSGDYYRDWDYQDEHFVTRDTGVIVFRFAADIADSSKFDPLFIEGFGCRIALEVCEPLTQSTTKLKNLASEYDKFMSEARTVNGIETGATQPPEDDYIACRV